jgi:uncharacterized protein (DUF2235 family)
MKTEVYLMKKKKKIIICADGTWNTPEDTDQGQSAPTNIHKMALALSPADDDEVSQLVYYHRGVGTSNLSDRIFGGGFGDGIDQNIKDCYDFLVLNFNPAANDEIYLMGFSRGAYTVRSLAGMIRNSGLLKRRHADKIDLAYQLYRDRSRETHPGSGLATAFRESFGLDVKIKCVAVWDTVGALGIPLHMFKFFNAKKYEFHDVGLSASIENAFHALAIDERRVPFEPAIWGVDETSQQNVSQTWFPGVHSNIGGGYADSELSNISFLWMKEKLSTARCNLAFDESIVKEVITPFSHTGVMQDSMSLVYRTLGELVRPIADTIIVNGKVRKTCTDLHPSVRLRRTHVISYKPANVSKYLGD